MNEGFVFTILGFYLKNIVDLAKNCQKNDEIYELCVELCAIFVVEKVDV